MIGARVIVGGVRSCRRAVEWDMERERPKVDNAVPDFVKGHVSIRPTLVIRSDGVCRLNPRNGAHGRGEGFRIKLFNADRPESTSTGRSQSRRRTSQLGGKRSSGRVSGKSVSGARPILRLRDGPDRGVRNVFKRRHQLFTRDAFALQHQTKFWNFARRKDDPTQHRMMKDPSAGIGHIVSIRAVLVVLWLLV